MTQMPRFEVHRDGRLACACKTLELALKHAGDQSHPKWSLNPFVRDQETKSVLWREGMDFFYNDFPDIALDEAELRLKDAVRRTRLAKSAP